MQESINYCDPKWRLKEDIKKCQSYLWPFYPVFKKTPVKLPPQYYKTFKNPHCAQCNFVDFYSLDALYNLIQEINNLRPTHGQEGFKPRPAPILAILSFKSFFSVDEYCDSDDEVWRKVTNLCGKSSCRGKGDCANTATFNSFPISKITHNDSSEVYCSKTPLLDAVKFINGSIYSPTYDLIFSEHEYKHENGTIYVCLGSRSEIMETLVQQYTTLIVLSISLCCLSFHFIFYGCFSHLRSWHGRNLLCLCVSLFLAQLLLLTGTQAAQNERLCLFVSVCLHYFWISSFCWLNVLSFDIWKTFKSACHIGGLHRKRTFLFYNLYSWGVPFVIVIPSLAIHTINPDSTLSPKYGLTLSFRRSCWMTNRNGIIYFFILPIGVIIGENLLLFITTSLSIRQQMQDVKFLNKKNAK